MVCDRNACDAHIPSKQWGTKTNSCVRGSKFQTDVCHMFLCVMYIYVRNQLNCLCKNKACESIILAAATTFTVKDSRKETIKMYTHLRFFEVILDLVKS